MAAVTELTLIELLRSGDRFGWSGRVYLPLDEAWEQGTRCAVGGRPSPDEGVLDEAPLGLTGCIGIEEVRQVVQNLAAQIPEPSAEQLVEAFLHYYDNDAFIEVT